MLLVLAAAKQVGLRCSQGFARSTGDVRQPGRLVSGGYPGRRLVCSRASSIYWFKVSFLLAGWFQVAIQAVDWFVPEHHLCIGVSFLLAGWFQVAIQAVDWFVPEHHLLV